MWKHGSPALARRVHPLRSLKTAGDLAVNKSNPMVTARPDSSLAALRRDGAPDAIYLDNGSSYRGEALCLCCERLVITLIHARPSPRRRLHSSRPAHMWSSPARRTPWPSAGPRRFGSRPIG